MQIKNKMIYGRLFVFSPPLTVETEYLAEEDMYRCWIPELNIDTMAMNRQASIHEAFESISYLYDCPKGLTIQQPDGSVYTIDTDVLRKHMIAIQSKKEEN